MQAFLYLFIKKRQKKVIFCDTTAASNTESAMETEAEARQETMLEYVVRKLNEPTLNLSALARAAGCHSLTLTQIRDGKSKSPRFMLVQSLCDYFKQLEK
jgi:DNA-binding Xre family transcriptional regulator